MVGRYLETEFNELSKRFSITIYSKKTRTPGTLLFALPLDSETASGHLDTVRRITFAGATWTERITPLPAYLAGERTRENSRTAMIAGCLLTQVLAGGALALTRSHLRVTVTLDIADRANRDLAERTRELAESEGRVRAKLEALLSPEGNLETLDLADIIDCSEFRRIMDDFFLISHWTVKDFRNRPWPGAEHPVCPDNGRKTDGGEHTGPGELFLLHPLPRVGRHR